MEPAPAREIRLPCRIAELLAIAEAHAPRSILSSAARARLRAIADPLPPLASEAGLECRLEGGDDRVDFAICLELGAEGRRRLAAALAEPEAPEAGASSPGWRRARAFLRAWAAPGAALHRTVSAAWLEFDALGDGRPPEPFLLFTLEPEGCYPGGAAVPALGALLREGLDLLSDGLDRDTASGVDLCLRALPCSAQVLHAAARPTRAGDVARLVVRMPWRALPGYLERVGWPGSRAELEAHLERLCARTLVHAINLDVGSGIGPRVGIEFYPCSLRADLSRRRSVLDDLEAAGTCTAEKRALLSAWPSGAPSPARTGASIRVERALMVKVVYEPGVPLRAKAYLGFGPRLALA